MDDKKIRIGGIKFSEELVQVTFVRDSVHQTSFEDLLRLLAGKRVNIPFICHSNTIDNPESSFCVLQTDLASVQEVLNFSSFTGSQVRIIPSVGTLTLFPHRNSFNLLGLVIGLFGESQYPVHSFSTSISAIAINTDHNLLDIIAEKLQIIIKLPENHAPFRQEFRLTQMP